MYRYVLLWLFSSSLFSTVSINTRNLSVNNYKSQVNLLFSFAPGQFCITYIHKRLYVYRVCRGCLVSEIKFVNTSSDIVNVGNIQMTVT